MVINFFGVIHAPVAGIQEELHRYTMPMNWNRDILWENKQNKNTSGGGRYFKHKGYT